MLLVKLLGVGLVLRSVRNVWSMIKSLSRRQATTVGHAPHVDLKSAPEDFVPPSFFHERVVQSLVVLRALGQTT